MLFLILFGLAQQKTPEQIEKSIVKTRKHEREIRPLDPFSIKYNCRKKQNIRRDQICLLFIKVEYTVIKTSQEKSNNRFFCKNSAMKTQVNKSEDYTDNQYALRLIVKYSFHGPM